MAKERIELRLSPINPDERALIEAINERGDEYGAKGQFLKDRILRGYATILAEVEGFLAETDPLKALEQRAASVDAMRFRVLKVLLTDRLRAKGVPVPASALPATPVMDSALDSVVGSNGQALEPVHEMPSTQAETAESAAGQVPEQPVEQAVEQPAPQHNWAAFRGLAGVKKEG